MFENTNQCIANCLKTRLGTHALYRNFGTNFVDENPSLPTRNSIVDQISRYFPDNDLQGVKIYRAEGSIGMFYYNANIFEG